MAGIEQSRDAARLPGATTRRWRITGERRRAWQQRPDGLVLLATVHDHDRAMRIADRLARSDDVDVSGTRIVGRDVELVEHLTGSLTWPRAVLGGGVLGLLVGAVIGGLLGALQAFAPFDGFSSGFTFGALFGLAIGAPSGAIARSLAPSRYREVHGMVAASYDIYVRADQLHYAERCVGDLLPEPVPEFGHMLATSATADLEHSASDANAEGARTRR